MCPEPKLISLYYDGELPSPWKEKMEAHLNSCAGCQSVLAGYRSLGDHFRDLPEKTTRAAQERVWKKLTMPELVASGNQDRWAGNRVWNRSVTLPLPVAAAAVFIIVVSLAFVGIRGMRQSPAQNSVATIGLDEQEILPIHDMTDVLQYLTGLDNGDFMVIRLPESRKFSRTGEPALINAADYSRRNIIR
jgi:hypothetical protein